jgi:hypothetical protein
LKILLYIIALLYIVCINKEDKLVQEGTKASVYSCKNKKEKEKSKKQLAILNLKKFF